MRAFKLRGLHEGHGRHHRPSQFAQGLPPWAEELRNARSHQVAERSRRVFPEAEAADDRDHLVPVAREHAGAAAASLAADVGATIAALYRRTSPDFVGKPPFADVRARGGFVGRQGRAPSMPRDETMLSDADYGTFVAAFERTGFRGANAWHLNDAANAVFAAEALGFGGLALPVLFVHAAWDTVCDTVCSALAVSMREDCANLSEATIEAGHSVMPETPDAVIGALDIWVHRKGLAL